MSEFQKPFVLFDSECTMCVRFKQILESLDKSNEINFYSARDPKVFEAFPELIEEDCLDTVHCMDENGKIYAGSDTVIYLSKVIPGIKKHQWLLETDAGRKAVDLFYTTVNNIRKSRLNTCPKCK